jgi:ADP-ribosyl-[dinitrogen reductase] hydrolase
MNVFPTLSLKERFAGTMMGIAVGDSVGLPGEGFSAERLRTLWKGEWKHRFCMGRGMASDDTEHAFFTVQALLQNAEDPQVFQRHLAWKLRWWFVGLPAGVGLATARAILKLWLGFPCSKSGVHSAGNGPAMRSGLIGLYFYDQPEKLEQFVRASTQLTHTDPKAIVGSLAIARVSAWIALNQTKRSPSREVLSGLIQFEGVDSEWKEICEKLLKAFDENLSVAEFAIRLGLDKGVSGYIYHTVPIAIYGWLRHSDNFESGLIAVWERGGDTDTTGSITGGLIGATTGSIGILNVWITGLTDWPRSRAVLIKAAQRLADQKDGLGFLGPVNYFWPGLLFRNIFFLAIVLLHGLRRLLP